MAKYEGINYISAENFTEGVHAFPGSPNVYWTDGSLDASMGSLMGRLEIAQRIGINVSDLVSFDPTNHTNEVVIVDSPAGLEQIEVKDNRIDGTVMSSVGRVLGWQIPKQPKGEDDTSGAEPRTYDGIILVGEKNFSDKYLLVTGADCTPVGLRGRLQNGEEVIAVLHGGRKGTMTGGPENLVTRLQFLGIEPSSVEVYIGPAAQSIEVPLELLEKESTALNPHPDNSWRVNSVSEHYDDAGTAKVEYDNQGDTARRLIEALGISPEQVRIVNHDTITNSDKLHSFRASKTPQRNGLLLGFSPID